MALNYYYSYYFELARISMFTVKLEYGSILMAQ